MYLKDLLTSVLNISWDKNFGDYLIDTISCDSREQMPNGLFVALGGFKFNGSDFIKEAIAHGAKVIVKSSQEPTKTDFVIAKDIAVILVQDPKKFLRDIASCFYDHSSNKVSTIGITGTNGKTTITYLLESIIHANQEQCAVIGTINYRIGNKIIPSKNTTPGFLDNQRMLARLSQLKVPLCVMETSSHALEQGRVDGINFCAAVFTNLTQDHLDYHKDMEHYFQAKALLFKGLSHDSAAVINVDDAYGRRLVNLTLGHLTTYAIDSTATIRAVNIQYHLSGTKFDIILPNGTLAINTRFIGRHNVYNILSAVACAHALNLELPIIKQGIEQLHLVPGRLEPVDGPQDFFIFIDYAHTEDGLINVLQALRAVSQDKLIVVFGCGGDRDKTKRPQMGKAVCGLADHAIVTSDNPRSEDPKVIIDEIVLGFAKNNYNICIDRRQAIEQALKMAQKGNIVLLAGKEHEDYQVLKDRTIHFNERKIVEEILR